MEYDKHRHPEYSGFREKRSKSWEDDRTRNATPQPAECVDQFKRRAVRKSDEDLKAGRLPCFSFVHRVRQARSQSQTLPPDFGGFPCKPLIRCYLMPKTSHHRGMVMCNPNGASTLSSVIHCSA